MLEHSRMPLEPNKYPGNRCPRAARWLRPACRITDVTSEPPVTVPSRMEGPRNNHAASTGTSTSGGSGEREKAPRNTGDVNGMGHAQGQPDRHTSPHDGGPDAEAGRGPTLCLEVDLRRSHGRFHNTSHGDWSVLVEAQTGVTRLLEWATREGRPEQTTRRGTTHPLRKEEAAERKSKMRPRRP
jgi:hypothetical protein